METSSALTVTSGRGKTVLAGECQRCGRIREIHPERTTPLCEDCYYVPEGTVLVVDEPTPCYRQDGFADLEAEAGERIDDPRVRTVLRRRQAVIAEVEGQLQEQFCGHCPMLADCLQWGRDNRYTGPAGGRWLLDGTVQGDPVCVRGHSRLTYAYRDGSGKLRCRVCTEESNKAAAKRRQRMKERRAA